MRGDMLTWWQDKFRKHMVKKYPEPERGESASFLDEYISGVKRMKTRLRKYDSDYKTLTAENAALESTPGAAENAGKAKIVNWLKYAGMEQKLRDLHALVDSIPPEIIAAAGRNQRNKMLERCGKYWVRSVNQNGNECFA